MHIKSLDHLSAVSTSSFLSLCPASSVFLSVKLSWLAGLDLVSHSALYVLWLQGGSFPFRSGSRPSPPPMHPDPSSHSIPSQVFDCLLFYLLYVCVWVLWELWVLWVPVLIFIEAIGGCCVPCFISLPLFLRYSEPCDLLSPFHPRAWVLGTTLGSCAGTACTAKHLPSFQPHYSPLCGLWGSAARAQCCPVETLSSAFPSTSFLPWSLKTPWATVCQAGPIMLRLTG